MNTLSGLQRERLKYIPPLPPLLDQLSSAIAVKEFSPLLPPVEPSIQELFPSLGSQSLLGFRAGEPLISTPLKVGVLLSGGPAPGGHNVIAGLFDALKKLHASSELIGFLDGPSGLINNQSIPLTAEKIAPYRNQGGFQMIGTSRTKIEKKEHFEAAQRTLMAHELDGMVIIGGDDSNTNAAFLAEFCRKEEMKTRIVGVPKTIDGDIKGPFIPTSFGFDTASKIYSELIGNLLTDAASSKKYYFFVKLMGRSASHIALECALQTHPHLTLISEEVADDKKNLTQVVEEIAELICERARAGKDHGVILIPEGLLEFIPECQAMFEELSQLDISSFSLHSREDFALAIERIKLQLSSSTARVFSQLSVEIQQQLLLEPDPHGNVQVSKIETERLLISLVQKELRARQERGEYKGKFSPQPIFYGYEGRTGLPSNFDCQYCYALGHVAALLVRDGASGYLSSIQNLHLPAQQWEMRGVPIINLFHWTIRKNKPQAVMAKALVDLRGKAFQEFKQARKAWRLGDLYRCPGPIQFVGNQELTDQPPLSIIL